MRTYILVGLMLLVALALSVSGDNAPPTLPPKDWPMPERWLPLDEEGWSIVKPAADSRLIYVSESEGDDETAEVYKPSDGTVGADPVKPTGAIKPFRTVEAAMAKTRDKMPDWVLLKRGDVWRPTLRNLSAKNGRSATEPSVICAYGKGERPMLQSVRVYANDENFRPISSNRVLMDIHLYTSMLDPKSPEFHNFRKEEAEKSGRCAIDMGASQKGGENILIENCRLQFCGFGFFGGSYKNFVVRRNVVADQYSVAGHSMGIWATGTTLLIEECILDHCGWLRQAVKRGDEGVGVATLFSHNSYCCNLSSTIWRNNIFARGSSINNKFTADGTGWVRNLIVDNNLYVDGEIGISMVGNFTGPFRWVDCRVINNVMLDLGKCQPTNRDLGWGIDIADWDGGIVANNLFLHQRNDRIKNVHAIDMSYPLHHQKHKRGEEADKAIAQLRNKPGFRIFLELDGYVYTEHIGTGIHSRNVLVENNIIHGLKSLGYVFGISSAELMGKVTIRNNQIQMPGLKTKLMDVSGEEIKGLKFEGNRYHSDADPKVCFRVNNKAMDFDEWVQTTGEKGAKVEKIEYPDDTRNIQNYMKHLGLEPTHEAFYAEIRKQRRKGTHHQGGQRDRTVECGRRGTAGVVEMGRGSPLWFKQETVLTLLRETANSFRVDSQRLKRASHMIASKHDKDGLSGDTPSHCARVATTVELTHGPNRIEIACVNTAGAESYRASRHIHYEGHVRQRLFYLGFGVSAYRDPDLSLGYAHKDAYDIADALAGPGGSVFDSIHTNVLQNAEVTLQAITEAKTFLADATVEDTVVLCIAGHGLHDTDRDSTYYFLPHGVRTESLKETPIPFALFEELLDSIKPRKKLFLMDTCMSGDMDDRERVEGMALASSRGIVARAIRGMKASASDDTSGHAT